MTSADTLTAVYVLREELTSATNLIQELDKFDVFPNPANDNFTVQFTLNEPATMSATLSNIQGKQIANFSQITGIQSSGTHQINLPVPNSIPGGLYLLNLEINGVPVQKKISIMN